MPRFISRITKYIFFVLSSAFRLEVDVNILKIDLPSHTLAFK